MSNAERPAVGKEGMESKVHAHTHKFICLHSTFGGVTIPSFKREGAMRSMPIILALGQYLAALMAQCPAPHPRSRIADGGLRLNERNDGDPLVLRR